MDDIADDLPTEFLKITLKIDNIVIICTYLFDLLAIVANFAGSVK